MVVMGEDLLVLGGGGGLRMRRRRRFGVERRFGLPVKAVFDGLEPYAWEKSSVMRREMRSAAGMGSSEPKWLGEIVKRMTLGGIIVCNNGKYRHGYWSPDIKMVCGESEVSVLVPTSFSHV